jgi:hypothetical protein
MSGKYCSFSTVIVFMIKGADGLKIQEGGLRFLSNFFFVGGGPGGGMLYGHIF